MRPTTSSDRPPDRGRLIRRALLLSAIVLLCTLPGNTYVISLTVSNGTVGLDRWGAPPVWHLNPSRGSNITGTRDLGSVATAAFATWMAAPNAVVSATRGADVSNGVATDGVNVLCFNCGTSEFTSSPGTLATTITSTSTSTSGGSFIGQIVEADIVFNPNIQYTTDCIQTGDAATGYTNSSACPSNGSAVHDLQTVLTHEVGHFFGMSHSGVVRSVMFPYSPNVEPSLGYDDVAGISLLYPKSTQDFPVGSVAGTVTLGGSGVFGAHVFVDSTSSALAYTGFNIRKTPIAALSLPDGTYTIQNVPPDTYTVTAEPLDLPVTNGDIADYAKAYSHISVQTDFTTRRH